MAAGLEVWRHNALAALKQAEQSLWEYVVKLAEADLGEELAQYLDRKFCSTEVDRAYPSLSPWRLNADCACLALRCPSCTEIMIHFRRESLRVPAETAMTEADIGHLNYLNWHRGTWYYRDRGVGNEDCCGKFAVVRYVIDRTKPMEPKVVPAPWHGAPAYGKGPGTVEGKWHFNDNAEHALIVAPQFFKEKEHLIAQAKEESELAKARELQRLRNITGG
jgi:hypothetical protein